MEAPISTTLALFAVLCFVLANGFFVATEFALVAVRRTRMQQLADEGHARAGAVLDRLNHLDTYIAATQLGITISSLALGWIGEPAVGHLIEPLIHDLPFLPEGSRETISKTVGVAIGFSIITALHIVIGELAPKSLALQRPEQTSLVAAGPVHIFYVLFRPIIYTLNNVGNWVVRLFGIEPAAGHAMVQSAEELQLAIGASRAAGQVDETAHDLIERAFDFPDLAARQVMVPRTEMSALPITASLADVIAIAADEGYTRLPVYEGDVDHIVGMLNVKRLMPVLREALSETDPSRIGDFRLADHIAEPLYVPETLPAPAVLRLMKEQRTQLAVVIDEYGGTAGIVALQDLVEELIGSIDDQEESADDEPQEVQDPAVLDGLMTIEDAIEGSALELGDPEELEVDTIGGYVFHRLGRVGAVGDEVELSDGRRLRVEAMDGLRVATVRIVPRPAVVDRTVPNQEPVPD
jgi:putative hemolysin